MVQCKALTLERKNLLLFHGNKNLSCKDDLMDHPLKTYDIHIALNRKIFELFKQLLTNISLYQRSIYKIKKKKRRIKEISGETHKAAKSNIDRLFTMFEPFNK